MTIEKFGVYRTLKAEKPWGSAPNPAGVSTPDPISKAAYLLKLLFTLPVLWVLVWMLLCVGLPKRVFAETRDIYPGDIITLKITSKDFSAEQLTEKFQEFEVIEIKDEENGYLISLRTFDVGEKKILIGDKEIVINVQSTLDNIEREDIFEGDARVIEAGIPFHPHIIFYLTTGVFVISGGALLLKTLLRKNKALSPRQLFLRRSAALSVDDDDYFVYLTLYFKEYLEGLHQCRIIGKTSLEIVNELKAVAQLSSMLPEIREWLTECDRLKFTGIKVSNDQKREHYNKLLELAEKIDTQKEVTA